MQHEVGRTSALTRVLVHPTAESVHFGSSQPTSSGRRLDPKDAVPSAEWNPPGYSTPQQSCRLPTAHQPKPVAAWKGDIRAIGTGHPSVSMIGWAKELCATQNTYASFIDDIYDVH